MARKAASISLSGVIFLSSCGVVSRMSLPRCSKMTRLAMASTSSIIWVEMMTMLRSPYCLIKLRMENFWLGSRPSVGSSKMSILGRCSSAPAMPTRRLYPLERVSHFRLMTSSTPALGQGYQIVHKILMADPAQTGHKPQVFVNRHLGIKCPAFGNISDPGQCLQAFAVNVITV